MTDYKQCNLCNKEFKKDFGDSENRTSTEKWWEIWKEGSRTYEVFTELETVEKIILPKLINKHPTEYNKQKTILSKVREVEKELMKPAVSKIEEILWKFFYKKGKMMPHFMYGGEGHSSTWDICESCSSELENLIKPHTIDQIENERIMNKFEEAGSKEIKRIDQLPFSDSEKDEMYKEKGKLIEEFLKNKEKELNNKILAERERERAKMARMAKIPFTLHESLLA